MAFLTRQQSHALCPYFSKSLAVTPCILLRMLIAPKVTKRTGTTKCFCLWSQHTLMMPKPLLFSHTAASTSYMIMDGPYPITIACCTVNTATINTKKQTIVQIKTTNSKHKATSTPKPGVMRATAETPQPKHQFSLDLSWSSIHPADTFPKRFVLGTRPMQLQLGSCFRSYSTA